MLALMVVVLVKGYKKDGEDRYRVILYDPESEEVYTFYTALPVGGYHFGDYVNIKFTIRPAGNRVFYNLLSMERAKS